MTVLARSCRFRMSALRSLTEGKQTCRGHAKIDANDTSMPLKKSQPPPDLVVRSTGEREDHDEGSEGPEWAIRGRTSSLSRRASGLSHRRAQISPTQKVPWHYHNNVHDTFYVLEGTNQPYTLNDACVERGP